MITCPHMCGKYRQDLDLLFCRPSGKLTTDNLADITICRDCIERAGLQQVNRFHDLCGITSVEIGFDEVFSLCEQEMQLHDSNRPIKACYLVPNELVYGTIRMYAALIESRGVEVYVSHNIDELAGILGIEASQLLTADD